VLDLIGKTPIVKLTKFDINGCELFVKLESQNPSGSIKDRIALAMIEDAEARGVLRPGGTIIEATAGNTGLGLALVAALKRYKLLLVIPDKMSQEKVRQVRALGAEVVITRSDVGRGHPAYYQDVAERLTKETPGAFYVNQFGNPANPRAHEESTGPEMWEQMNYSIDAVVCGVGSGGTMTGLGRFFARVSPTTEMVLGDPVGSILDHYIKTGEVLKESGSWLVEGMGEDFIPPVSDLSYVRKSYAISDGESFEIARELLRREGILAGTSTGLLVAAALKYCKEQTTPKRVITFVCDSGSRYLTKIFDYTWLRDQGLLAGTVYGDLRDLVTQKVFVSKMLHPALFLQYRHSRLCLQ
jgi:cystathionine beta-synthase